MKYEKPEVTALPPAIDAIQATSSKVPTDTEDNGKHLSISPYEDNE